MTEKFTTVKMTDKLTIIAIMLFKIEKNKLEKGGLIAGDIRPQWGGEALFTDRSGFNNQGLERF